MTNPTRSLATAVLDANGIIGLSKGGCLSSVRHLFGLVVVPTAVVLEVTDSASIEEILRDPIPGIIL